MSSPLLRRLARRHAPERFDPTRRALLAAAGAAALAHWTGGCASRRPRAGAARIVVVGAGFAGLACADRLAQAGLRVDVLEARARVGGRVSSVKDGASGRNIEAGAELIGSNHPCWMRLKERFGLALIPVPEDEGLETPVVLQGRRLGREEAAAAWSALESAQALLTDLAAPLDAERPWASPFALELDARDLGGWIDEAVPDERIARLLHAELAANNGVATRRQSLLAMLAQVRAGGLADYWAHSEDWRCAGGNQQLAERLAADLPDEALRLATPVARIEHDDSGARVTTASGDVFVCDHVVLAVPPSTWGRIEFVPPLPAGLAPQMGTNVKYVASVSRRFWRDAGAGQYAYSDGEVSMTWDPTSGQDGDDPGEHGSSAPIEVPAALTAFSGGPAAEACRARTGVARRDAYAHALELLHPGFAQHVGTTRFYDWPGEEWTRAGYAIAAPGEVTSVLPRLVSGLGRLQFAGEHASAGFVGYMEGALQSGFGVAERIASSSGRG